MTRSVRAFSHSCSFNPYDSKSDRMSLVPQPSTFSRIGTITLDASSLSTVRLRDARQLLVLGHRNRVALAVVDVQHHVHVRAAVADVDRCDPVPIPSCVFELLDDGDLAVAGRHALDRSHLTGVVVVLELGAEDVVGRDDAGERRLDDLARRRRDDEERKAMPVDDRGRGARRAPAGCCAAGRAGRSPRGARAGRRETPDRGESGRRARLPGAPCCCAPARRPSPGNRDAPINSLRTAPESLKLSV